MRIMEPAAKQYSGSDLYQINQCRISLQIAYLSDIVSVESRRVLMAYHSGNGHADVGRRTRLNWPPM